MTTSKPSIAPEAQHRIRSFVQEVEALQERWGVRIAGTDLAGDIALVDAQRKQEWIGPDGFLYAEHDASMNMHQASENNWNLENLQIEDFDGWGK